MGEGRPVEGWLNKYLRESLSETAEEAYAKIEDNDDTEMHNCKLSDSKLMISRAEKKTPERGEWSNPVISSLVVLAML